MNQFSANETLELMYVNNASSLRNIADHIELFEMDWQEVVNLLREIADEQEAQSMVVKLRDQL